MRLKKLKPDVLAKVNAWLDVNYGFTLDADTMFGEEKHDYSYADVDTNMFIYIPKDEL